MYKKPEILMTDIPVASPYYDRLRSLNMQLGYAPTASSLSDHLKRQITELTDRAKMRILADVNITKAI